MVGTTPLQREASRSLLGNVARLAGINCPSTPPANLHPVCGTSALRPAGIFHARFFKGGSELRFLRANSEEGAGEASGGADLILINLFKR
jgi:hypothetical protein